MTALNKMPVLLIVALGLAVGCGDDKDDGDDNGKTDAGVDAGGGDKDGGGELPAETTACNGLYTDLTFGDMLANLEKTGACISAPQVAEICTTDPTGAAATAGKNCFIAMQYEENLQKCTVDGKDGIPGLRASSPGLSDDCLDCYAAAVVCSAKFCAAPCVANSSGTECETCREDNDCNPDFYTCSGLPRPENLKD